MYLKYNNGMNFNQNSPYIPPVDVDPRDEMREDQSKYRNEVSEINK